MTGLLNTRMLWSRLLTLLAMIAAVLVVVNMFLFVANQRLNREVAERQQFIVQSAQIQGIAKEIVTALANLAVKNNDEQLKQLLASHGITYSVPSSGAADRPGPADGAKR
jgi:hypothetical protein